LHKLNGTIETIEDIIKDGKCSIRNVYNGQEIQESDKLLSEALTEHFKPKGILFLIMLCIQMEEKQLGGFSKRKVYCHSFNKYMITI
jgi:hypothetical protein